MSSINKPALTPSNVEEEEILFSIIVPVYNTPRDYLERCVASVKAQTFNNWQLILIDDASTTNIHTKIVSMSEKDARIEFLLLEKNQGISGATNEGLKCSRGKFIVFLDHDDELFENSLEIILNNMKEHPDTDIFYSDQVKIDRNGKQIEHFFKPDWSPVYMLGVMYVGHLLIVRGTLAKNSNGFDHTFDGVQDYEFVLRLSEKTSQIVHIQEALYKWRAIPGSIAAASDAKTNIDYLHQKAVEQHLLRLGRSWSVAQHPILPHRLNISFRPQSNSPKVSIIIPTRDQGELLTKCLESIFKFTNYPDFEVILVDNQTVDPVALASMKNYTVKIIHFNEKFNFSAACNAGAKASSGELLLFLNNDTEVLEHDWLEKLVCYFEDDQIGVTGPILLYPDGRIQHAGVVIGPRGTADHVMRFFPNDVDGYAGSLSTSREVSAVTAACMVIRRGLFFDIGCFSTDFNKHYQDVDLCLKVREQGYRIISVANTRLTHHESVSRQAEGYDFVDRAIFIDRWYETIISGDPYYNKNLSVDRLDYSLNLRSD
jgi:O-antigen biosynthesis protein